MPGMVRDEEPTWQPATAVGTLTAVVAEQLDFTREQLALMEQARPGRLDAKVLDDHTVSETLRVYGVMAEDYQTLFAVQGRRWQDDKDLSPALREKVDAYIALVDQQIQALDAILELTREIAGHTIEKVMAKSDLELGLETLLGPHFGRTDR
jgi:hypothetical protein